MPSAKYFNNITNRCLQNLVQIMRRVMTAFYMLFPQEECNCHNIKVAKVYKVMDQPGPGSPNVHYMTAN